MSQSAVAQGAVAQGAVAQGAVAQGAVAQGAVAQVAGPLLEDVGAALRNARPDGPQERFEQTAWLALLASTGDGLLRREQAPAHLTASAAVLSPDGSHTCLVFHHRMQLWVQPGGHFEPSDTSGAQAAAREVAEETGLTGRISSVPALLSRHPAPCAPGVVDWHLDLQYLIVAEQNPPTPSDESPRVAWWPVGSLPAGLASGVPELVQRAGEMLAGQPDLPYLVL